MAAASTDPATAVIRPSDNVYSYFNFMVPVEEKRAGGKFTWNKTLAYALVILSVFLQSTLLFAIFAKVVKTDVKWQNKILNPQGQQLGETQNGFLQNPFSPPPAKCNPGGSLCFKTNGTVSCAPPTVQLTGRWEELDTDGDGIWTLEEVTAAKEELQCKYSVNPVEVFDVFIRFLKDREKVIWLHPDIKDRKAIPKPYFTYAAGDIIMCGYRSADMCANVLRMGVFDAPLKYNTAPRVGNTIDSALDYCYELLKPGGTCERTLPSTYAVWRKNGEELCLEADYDPWTFTHPTTGISKSMLVVDYDARKNYSRANGSALFFTYKCIIIGLFLLFMFNELKDILTNANWCILFPSAKHLGDEAVVAEKDDDGNMIYTVQGISTMHRATMTILILIRSMMLGTLIYVGLLFLLMDTDYIDLLLNAVGFVFIVEIANQLYACFLDHDLKELCENMVPMQVHMLGIDAINRNAAMCNILGIAFVVSVTFGIMFMHRSLIVEPLWQALECTCLAEGEACLEANKFNPVFWENYWREDVPAVFKEVDKIKAATLPPAVSSLARAIPGLDSRLLLSHHAKHHRHKHHKHHKKAKQENLDAEDDD